MTTTLFRPTQKTNDIDLDAAQRAAADLLAAPISRSAPCASTI